jgi:hypothetical protein
LPKPLKHGPTRFTAAPRKPEFHARTHMCTQTYM